VNAPPGLPPNHEMSKVFVKSRTCQPIFQSIRANRTLPRTERREDQGLRSRGDIAWKVRELIVLVFCLGLVVAASAPTFATNADAIYFSWPIVTVNDRNPNAEAVAVKAGKIVAVGTPDRPSACALERAAWHSASADRSRCSCPARNGVDRLLAPADAGC
jgi:hypothetical protein